MKHFFYLLILISFVGCNKVDRPKKPKDIISKDKMSEIMYDLYILNAAKGVNRKLLELNGIMPMDYIYRKYGIDSLQFAESNTYYSYDTDAYARIIEKMTAELQKDKDLFEKLNTEEQKVADSLKILDKELNDPIKIIENDTLN